MSALCHSSIFIFLVILHLSNSLISNVYIYPRSIIGQIITDPKLVDIACCNAMIQIGAFFLTSRTRSLAGLRIA